MTGPLFITAWLSSPLAGEPPQLDSLLEWSLSPFSADFQELKSKGVPHGRIDRAFSAPEPGVIRIPIERVWLGKFLVAHCSDPILPLPAAEGVDHICKRIAVEASGLLLESERKMVTTTNSWTKSYRLPLRVRAVDRVCWFATGNRRNTQKSLRDIHAVGKKVADGYGRVKAWEVADIAEDYSWFAKSEGGTVLMRTLPRLIDDNEWLPKDLVGARRYYGAASPPYWHRDRFTEVMQPC